MKDEEILRASGLNLNQELNVNMTSLVDSHPLPGEASTSSSFINLAQKEVYDDYFKFFTTKEGIDLLPYAYQDHGYTLDVFVKDPNYYPMQDEVDIIKKNKNLFSKYLKNVSNIIEIGPGSDFSLEHKTLPLMRYAENLETYYALDISKYFLKQACNYIKKNIHIKTYFHEVDLTRPGLLPVMHNGSGQNAAIMLGITLGNMTSDGQNLLVQKVGSVLNKNDVFIFSVDTNIDEESIEKAYNRGDDFHMYPLYYLATINSSFQKYLYSLESGYRFDKNKRCVSIYYKTKRDFGFWCPFYGYIKLSKDQEFLGIKVTKFSTEYITSLMHKNYFKVLDIVNNSDKVVMFICSKL